MPFRCFLFFTRLDDKLEVSDCKGFDIRFFEQLELMRQAQTEEAFAALDLMSDVFEVCN